MAGCAAKVPSVSVLPERSSAPLRQTFARAFVSRQSDFGEDQVVLVNAPIDQPTPVPPGQPIPPNAGPPLHTVMSVRLHWRATTGAPTSTAGMNAVLHWYVYGTFAGGKTSLIHYVGTGFVTLANAGDGATVEVTHGQLHEVDRYGDVRDPLGTFDLAGSFHAVTSDRQVAETIADVSAAVANARADHPRPASRP